MSRLICDTGFHNSLTLLDRLNHQRKDNVISSITFNRKKQEGVQKERSALMKVDKIEGMTIEGIKIYHTSLTIKN